MRAVGLFEAKTKFSEICDEVARNRKPVVITKRGAPLVIIAPTHRSERQSVWEARRAFETTQGRLREKLALPRRLKSGRKTDFLGE